MSTWGIVAIVAILASCIPQIVRARKGIVGSKERRQLEQRLEELERQNGQLAERVKVLETIVTDSGFELDKEIRKLG